LELGLDYDLFWRLTPHDMAVVVRGRRAAIREAHERARMVAYETAQWVAYAFHEPKRMPKFKLMTADTTVDERQQMVDDAQVRGWFIAMSLKTAH